MHAAALIAVKGIEQRAMAGLSGLFGAYFQVKECAAVCVVNRQKAAGLATANVVQPVQMLGATKALVAIGMAGDADGAQQGRAIRATAACGKKQGGGRGAACINAVQPHQRAFVILCQHGIAIVKMLATAARAGQVVGYEKRWHGSEGFRTGATGLQAQHQQHHGHQWQHADIDAIPACAVQQLARAERGHGHGAKNQKVIERLYLGAL